MRNYFVRILSITMILVLFISTGICDHVYSNKNGGVLKVSASDPADPALDTHVKAFKVKQADGVITTYDIENLRVANPDISSVLHQLPSNGETTVPTVEVYDVELVNPTATYTLDGIVQVKSTVTLNYGTYSVGKSIIEVSAGTAPNIVTEEFTVYFSDGKIEATDIKRAGISLFGFSSDRTDYSLRIDELDTIPDFTVITSRETASVARSQREELGNTIVTYTVRELDNTGNPINEKAYNITIGRHKTTYINDITLDGVSMVSFDRNVTDYEISIPYASTVAPTVGYVKGDATQTIVLEQATFSPYNALVQVRATDLAMRDYTITFVRETNDSDTTLKTLTMDGRYDSKFQPFTKEYNYEIPEANFDFFFRNIGYSGVANNDGATVTGSVATFVPQRNGDQKGTAIIRVTAVDGTVGEYTINITVKATTPILSNDADLSSFKINGSEVAGFSSDTLDYTATITHAEAQSITITGEKSDSFATLDPILQPVFTGDGEETKTVTVKVTAEDGVTIKTYSLALTKQARPLSSDASLSTLKVNGTEVTGFRSDNINYTVTITHEEAASANVEAEVKDANARITMILQPSFITEAEEVQLSVVNVRAEDGTTKTYTLNIIKEARILSKDSKLIDIKANGVTLPGFVATTANYTKQLPWDTTVVPTLTYSKSDARATVTLNPGTFELKEDGRKEAVVTLVVTAEDASFTTTYEIYFIVKPLPLSNDATLTTISVGGVPLENFAPTKYSYKKSLPAGTTTPPVITYITSHPGATVEKTVPAFSEKADKSLESVARLRVTSEDVKVTTSYIITLTVPKPTTTEPTVPTDPTQPINPTTPEDESSNSSSKDKHPTTLTERQKEELIDKDMEGYLKDITQKGIDTKSSKVAKDVVEDILHVIEYTNEKDLRGDNGSVEDDEEIKMIIDAIEDLEHPISKLKDDQDIIDYTEDILQEVNIYQDAHEIKDDITQLKLALSSVDLAKRAIGTVATKKLKGTEVKRIKRRVGITITDDDLEEIKEKKDKGVERLKDEVDAIFKGQEYQLESVPVVIQAPKLSQQIIGVDVTVNKKTLVDSDKVLVRTDFCSFTLDEGVFDESLEDITISQTKSQLKPKGLDDIEIIDTPVMDFVATKGEKTIKAFEEPLTTSFKLDQEVYEDYTEEQLESLTIFYYNEETEEWEPVGGKFDPVTQTITTELPHFSQYTVMLSNKSFSDVNQNWARKEINIMLRKGIIDEGSDFSPTQRISRAEFSSWVSKAFRIDSITGELPFEDVKMDHPYYEQILAAFTKEIIKGKTETLFDADGFISREEIAALVTRALARYKDMPISENIGEILGAFIDKEDIARWAESGVATAIAEKLIYGYPNKSYRPQKNTQKDEAAVLIYNIYYR